MNKHKVKLHFVNLMRCGYYIASHTLVIGFTFLVTWIIVRETVSNVLLQTIISASVVFYAHWMYLQKWEKDTFYNNANFIICIKEFIKGLIIGLSIVGISMLILWLLDTYKVVGINNNVELEYLIASDFAYSFGEEIVFRAVIARLIYKYFGIMSAVVISSVFFGMMHTGYTTASLLTGIMIAVEAGILLCVTYLYTTRIWLPFGIHFSWNATQSILGGLSANGEAKYYLILERYQTNMLTGYSYGIEESIILFLLASGTGIYYLYLLLGKEKDTTAYATK